MTAPSPGGVVYEPSDKAPFTMGLDYVAASRCQNASDLVLTRPLRLDGFLSHTAYRSMIKNDCVDSHLHTVFDEIKMNS